MNCKMFSEATASEINGVLLCIVETAERKLQGISARIAAQRLQVKLQHQAHRI